jgi:predicted Zn finger-like uncharacterized protein
MRLICPVCSAQYDVDAELIPAAGRDVECSACGKVWFVGPGRVRATPAERGRPAAGGQGAGAQEAGGIAAGDRDASGAVDAGRAGAGEAAVAAGMREARADPAARLRMGDSAAGGTGVAGDVAEAPPGPAEVAAPESEPVVPRRTVTPAIAGILRAEAERERANRAAEARATPERQEEFPLDAPEAAAATGGGSVTKAASGDGGAADDLAAAIKKIVSEETTRIVRDAPPERPAATLDVPAASVRAVDPPPAATEQLGTVSRRDRLPDIEEISSTLSPVAAMQARYAKPAPRRRSGIGFRLGFGLVLWLATVLAMVYIYAPRIVAEYPQTEPYIRPYVDAVDESRLWLDLQLQRVVKALDAEGATGG